MRERGSGSVVVVSSIAAFKGFPNHAAYCASKGALVALVRQVAIDYGPAVRVNVLCPGPVDTPLIWDSAAAFPEPDEGGRRRRRADPDEAPGSARGRRPRRALPGVRATPPG